jgi:hypothetical protein
MKRLLRLVALLGSPFLWTSASWATGPAAVDQNYALRGWLIMSWDNRAKTGVSTKKVIVDQRFTHPSITRKPLRRRALLRAAAHANTARIQRRGWRAQWPPVAAPRRITKRSAR